MLKSMSWCFITNRRSIAWAWRNGHTRRATNDSCYVGRQGEENSYIVSAMQLEEQGKILENQNFFSKK